MQSQKNKISIPLSSYARHCTAENFVPACNNLIPASSTIDNSQLEQQTKRAPQNSFIYANGQKDMTSNHLSNYSNSTADYSPASCRDCGLFTCNSNKNTLKYFNQAYLYNSCQDSRSYTAGSTPMFISSAKNIQQHLKQKNESQDYLNFDKYLKIDPEKNNLKNLKKSFLELGYFDDIKKPQNQPSKIKEKKSEKNSELKSVKKIRQEEKKKNKKNQSRIEKGVLKKYSTNPKMRMEFPDLKDTYSDPDSYKKLLKQCNLNWFNGTYDAKTKIIFIVGDNLTSRAQRCALFDDRTNLVLNKGLRITKPTTDNDFKVHTTTNTGYYY